MNNFVTRVVKQAKLMIALNKGQIDTIANGGAFKKVGLMILIKGNTSEWITQCLLRNSEIAKDKIIVDTVKNTVQEILDSVPDEVKKYYEKKKAGELLELRDKPGIFKQKMDQITEHVKTAFLNIANERFKKHSENIDEAIKKWKIK